MDALVLARMQFAANITFHILFPTINIALAWMLMFFRWRWLATDNAAWLGAYRFWTKVFALSFADMDEMRAFFLARHSLLGLGTLGHTGRICSPSGPLTHPALTKSLPPAVPFHK